MEENGIVAVCRLLPEGLLRREKDVFSRQLSVHFGSMSFLRRFIVLTSWSFAESFGGRVRIRPRGRNNGAFNSFPPIPSPPWLTYPPLWVFTWCGSTRESENLTSFYQRISPSVWPRRNEWIKIVTSKNIYIFWGDMDPKWTDGCLLKTSFLNSAWVCCCWWRKEVSWWLYYH